MFECLLVLHVCSKYLQEIPANITSTCWKTYTDDVSNAIRNKYFYVITMHDELMQLWCLKPLTFWLLQYRQHNARMMPFHISEAMNYMIRIILHMDHFVHAPSQWEKTLQYNILSDWLGGGRIHKMILLTAHWQWHKVHDAKILILWTLQWVLRQQ